MFKLNDLILDANQWLKKHNLCLVWINNDHTETTEIGESDTIDSVSANHPATPPRSNFGQRLKKKIQERTGA